jgi:hypothetical protein
MKGFESTPPRPHHEAVVMLARIDADHGSGGLGELALGGLARPLPVLTGWLLHDSPSPTRAT